MVIQPIGTVRLTVGPSLVEIERTPTRTEPSRFIVLTHDAASALAKGIVEAVETGKAMALEAGKKMP